MSSLLSALRGQRPEQLPVWFMRQAGRSLPEYKEARAGTTILEACLRPELAAEITLQPVRRHGVDAAIFFSDIVIPLAAAGEGLYSAADKLLGKVTVPGRSGRCKGLAGVIDQRGRRGYIPALRWRGRYRTSP